MSQRTTVLALVLVALSSLAGAAKLPVNPAAPPAVTAPAPATNLAWLQPAPNSSVEKPDVTKNGAAPLGAIFQSCSSGCNSDKVACVNGCLGDHDCIVNCNNDYLCCLRTCNPQGPQCF